MPLQGPARALLFVVLLAALLATKERVQNVGSAHTRESEQLQLADRGPWSGRRLSWHGGSSPHEAGHSHLPWSRRLLQEAQPGTSNSSSSFDEEPEAADEETEWVQSLSQLQQLPAWVDAGHSVTAMSDGNCPGCSPGACTSSDGGFRCSSCAGSLFVSRADGSCGCPGGKYQPENQPNVCKDCEKGFFCAGGKYTGPGFPVRTSCSTFGDGLTTLGARSIAKRLCVNLPGYSYNLDAATSDPVATPCPVDTYGPGLKKQRACVPCPAGFTSLGRTKLTTAQGCSVAAGYFQITPGRVAPCPRGTWRSADAANCTACVGAGVTTPGEAATSALNCSDVVSGSYATSVVDGVVRATDKCPQKYYCPGGTAKQSISVSNIPSNDPTIVRCPRGLWTQGLGSNVEALCVTPPGHFTTATETKECPNGEYRTGWAAPAEAASCVKCSPDLSMQSMGTEILNFYSMDGREVFMYVRSLPKSCYIIWGQGLVAGPDNTFRAVNCDNNNWGVSDNTFGFSAPACRSCPNNLVTNKNPITNPISAGYYKADNSTPPRGGFNNEGACVTAAGWGLDKGVAEPCDTGTWSAGDNREPCRTCPFGMTTGPDSTRSSQSDCMIAPGFGWLRSSIAPCPVGTYNDQIRENNRTQCLPCPGGSTGTVEGATSTDSCNLCKAGYGGTACDMCGGNQPNFGPGVRPKGTECVACPALGGEDGGGGVGGFQFLDPKGGQNWFSPRVIAAIAATRPTECIAEFTQVSDNAWNLAPQNPTDWGSRPITVEAFAACVELCTFDEACQFLQYDYATEDGNCRLKVAPTMATTNDLLCFKAIPSTDVGASSIQPTASPDSITTEQAVQQLFSSNSSVGAKAVVSSGKYTIWRDTTASRIGEQSDPPQGIALTYDSCFMACDEDSECAGVYMSLEAVNVKPAVCKIIKGDKTAGVFKRAMTRMRADVEHMDMFAIVGAQ